MEVFPELGTEIVEALTELDTPKLTWPAQNTAKYKGHIGKLAGPLLGKGLVSVASCVVFFYAPGSQAVQHLE